MAGSPGAHPWGKHGHGKRWASTGPGRSHVQACLARGGCFPRVFSLARPRQASVPTREGVDCGERVQIGTMGELAKVDLRATWICGCERIWGRSAHPNLWRLGCRSLLIGGERPETKSGEVRASVSLWNCARSSGGRLQRWTGCSLRPSAKSSVGGRGGSALVEASGPFDLHAFLTSFVSVFNPHCIVGKGASVSANIHEATAEARYPTNLMSVGGETRHVGAFSLPA